MVARLAQLFVVTIPELVFAQTSTIVLSSGETRLVWWVFALVGMLFIGLTGLIASFRRADKYVLKDGTLPPAEDFTLIEEEI